MQQVVSEPISLDPNSHRGGHGWGRILAAYRNPNPARSLFELGITMVVARRFLLALSVARAADRRFHGAPVHDPT